MFHLTQLPQLLPSTEPHLVNERKFAGHIASLQRVMAVVEQHCPADDWFATGVVNSIYFDTPRFSAYSEKANGDNLKTKVRLRWYGLPGDLPETVPAFLEIKGRIGSARNKTRTEMDLPRRLLVDTPLDSPDFLSFLGSAARTESCLVPLGWRPVCCISYSRRRYFDMPSMSRISIDWDIRADRFNRAVFPWAAPVALDSFVCEFKNSGGTPPPWAEDMLAAGMRLGSFSKYGECMERLLEGVP